MTRNVAASVRARLANHSRVSQRPFQEVLQHFALERFLYRLAQSPYRDQFLLKGALLLTVWGAESSRPTRDIDLLGYVNNDLATLAAIMRAVCESPVLDDGLRFDGAGLTAQRIKEDAEYAGVRITFTGYLEQARMPMQLDVGFGDVIHPRAEERDYPTLLDFPAPRLRMYPRETVVAEKLEAMVQLGTLNSRMKDFFDVWLLARHYDFSGAALAVAIAKTFEQRKTKLEIEPVALTPAFTAAEATQKQWTAFVRRSHLQNAPATLEEARVPLRAFLLPPVAAVVTGQSFNREWLAPGPWDAPARDR